MILRRLGTLLSFISFAFVFGFPTPSLASENSFSFNGRVVRFSLRDEAITHLLTGDQNYSPAYVTSALAPGTIRPMFITAYTSESAQTDSTPFITASGTRVHPGTAAANFLPFGSILEINGRFYTVEDRLNSRYNQLYIVDIWFESLQEARAFGAQIIPVTVRHIPE